MGGRQGDGSTSVLEAESTTSSLGCWHLNHLKNPRIKWETAKADDSVACPAAKCRGQEDTSPIPRLRMAVPGGDPSWWLKDSGVWPPGTERRANLAALRRLFHRVKGSLWSLLSKNIYQLEREHAPAAHSSSSSADWG